MASNKKGQGLIELIIAIAVISTGLFSVWTLFQSNFNGEQEAKARVVGANLAREGLEAVKNIRDSNWLHGDENQYDEEGNFWEWDHGLATGDHIVSGLFTTTTDGSYDGMASLVSISGAGDPATKLYLDDSGFFVSDDSGSYSGYSRLVTIRNICCQSSEGEDVVREQCSSQAFEVTSDGCASDQAKIGLDVASMVSWQVEGKARSITMQEQLFNWR